MILETLKVLYSLVSLLYIKDGKQIYDPHWCNRQVYCCETIYNICDNLLDIAKWFSKLGKEIYSFYHALGMSCIF